MKIFTRRPVSRIPMGVAGAIARGLILLIDTVFWLFIYLCAFIGTGLLFVYGHGWQILGYAIVGYVVGSGGYEAWADFGNRRASGMTRVECVQLALWPSFLPHDSTVLEHISDVTMDLAVYASVGLVVILGLWCVGWRALAIGGADLNGGIVAIPVRVAAALGGVNLVAVLIADVALGGGVCAVVRRGRQDQEEHR